MCDYYVVLPHHTHIYVDTLSRCEDKQKNLYLDKKPKKNWERKIFSAGVSRSREQQGRCDCGVVAGVGGLRVWLAWSMAWSLRVRIKGSSRLKALKGSSQARQAMKCVVKS